MAEALAVVKVGYMACEFLKLTPRSRTSAIAGAVSPVTIRPRNPSGTNRMTLCGRWFWANEEAVQTPIRPANNIISKRRIEEISPTRIKPDEPEKQRSGNTLCRFG